MSSHEQDATQITASVQGQPGSDSISFQLQSPWMNQFVSGDDKVSVEGETRETRLTTGSPGQRPERRVRDRGVIREGLSGTNGSEAYSRVKNSRRDSSSKSTFQDTAASQGMVFPVSLYDMILFAANLHCSLIKYFWCSVRGIVNLNREGLNKFSIM